MASDSAEPLPPPRSPVREREFRELYLAHASRIYNYVLWLTRSREASDDILQTVFIKVWQQPAIPRNPDEQGAWLFTVARNACMDFFRSSQRFTRLRQAVGDHEETRGEQDSDARFVWDMLAHLTSEERSIIYLHVKMGYNYREIGAILTMQESAVRVRAFRALRRLRATLEKEAI